MPVSRRNFVKNVAITAAGLSVFDPFTGFGKATDAKLKVGIIGTGLRGQAHLGTLLRRDDVQIVAICDIDARMLQMSRDLINKSGKAMPKIYTGDDLAYRKLLDAKEIEAVVIATPWEWHKPMITDALSAGNKIYRNRSCTWYYYGRSLGSCKRCRKK